jgi:hypothetical protein
MSRNIRLTILVFCILKLTLHLIADSHSGFQGDELLHIETGKHLAWGYMEFPPMIGLFAFIQNLFHSQAVVVHHLFSHLASLIILVMLAKITFELGGREKAVFFVLLAFIVAPASGRSEQLFQPVVFSQMFWVLSFYQLVRFVKYEDNTFALSPARCSARNSLWWLTVYCIAGFLTKYDTVFFIFGLVALLLYKQTRDKLIAYKAWINILVVIACVLPNIIWQATHQYPALQMFSRLYETQLDKLSRVGNIGELLLAMNPIVSLLLILPGIYFIVRSFIGPGFTERSAPRPVAIAILLSFLFLLFKNGKSYYFFPLAFTLLPFGAVFLENAVDKRKWLLYPVAAFLLIGCLLIPLSMPVYSFSRYLSHYNRFEKKQIPGGETAIKYDEYYTKEKWRNTMQLLKSVYDSLPAAEKTNCLIWGKHYGQAGAVNLFGGEAGLPKAFSYHGSFYLWSPKEGTMPGTIIGLSYNVGEFFQPFFGEVHIVRQLYNPYADSEEELYQYVYVLKQPKQDWAKMRELFNSRIFE